MELKFYLLFIILILAGCDVPHENGEVVPVEDLNLSTKSLKLKVNRVYKTIFYSSNPPFFDNSNLPFYISIDSFGGNFYYLKLATIYTGDTNLTIGDKNYSFHIF